MRAARIIGRGRRLAESLMVDTWRCERPGESTFDDETGEWSAAEPEEIYNGPGRLRDPDSTGTREEVQGETTTASRLVLWLPIATSGDVRVDDVLECTVAPHDAALVGIRVRVIDLHLQTHSTARRFTVEMASWPRN